MAESRAELLKRLKAQSKEMRKLILKTSYNAGQGHVAPAYSAVEMTSALYFHAMKFDPKKPDWVDRDRLIFSAGHKCLNQYVALAMMGAIPMSLLDTFDQLDSCLGGHPIYGKCAGVDASTGSLGHGLPIGCGMAIAAKNDKKDYRVYVIMGDGETHEGSVWEGALSANKFKLDNLVAIIDYNKQTVDGPIDKVMPIEPFADKWRAFNFATKEIDGHNLEEVVSTLERLPFEKGKPNCIIAHTTKGKGVSFMTNNPAWHMKAPNKQEFEAAMKEIEAMD